MQWFCVYTEPNQEKRACDAISDLDFEIFLPTYRKIVVHARRRRPVTRPLFSRYLFVSFDLSSGIWPEIKRAKGVEGIISSDGKPVAIFPEIIERLKIWTASGLFDQQNNLRIGGKARVMGGPFAEQIGAIARASDNKRVEILLNMLGQEARVTLSLADIELL